MACNVAIWGRMEREVSVLYFSSFSEEWFYLCKSLGSSATFNTKHCISVY